MSSVISQPALFPHVKQIVVDTAPHMNTIINAVVFSPTALHVMSDRDIIRGWKWCNVGHHLLRLGSHPLGYVHRRDHSLLAQWCDAESVAVWTAEMVSRGLAPLYELTVLISANSA